MRKSMEKVKKIKGVWLEKDKERKNVFPTKLFGKWDVEGIEVRDQGLFPYIAVDTRFIPRSAGKHRNPFHKSKANIVERLAQHIIVPGHQGKKHKTTSGPLGGQLYNALKSVERALQIVEEKEKKNPVEVLVKAIENAALREEIITYQLGSIVAREGVITAPQRRVDKTLRFLAQGAFKKTFNKKTKLAEALADEIIAAYQGKQCLAIQERDRMEKEAAGAR